MHLFVGQYVLVSIHMVLCLLNYKYCDMCMFALKLKQKKTLYIVS